jgi:hypothetical protein
MLPWGEARIKLPWAATFQMFDKQVQGVNLVQIKKIMSLESS